MIYLSSMDNLEYIKQLNKGKSVEDLEKELEQIDLQRAKEPGKIYGECESCGMKTVLVKEVSLCGPCCFGEADTINGNW